MAKKLTLGSYAPVGTKKTTSQGNGTNSVVRKKCQKKNGKKPYRGQGK